METSLGHVHISLTWKPEFKAEYQFDQIVDEPTFFGNHRSKRPYFDAPWSMSNDILVGRDGHTLVGLTYEIYPSQFDFNFENLFRYVSMGGCIVRVKASDPYTRRIYDDPRSTSDWLEFRVTDDEPTSFRKTLGIDGAWHYEEETEGLLGFTLCDIDVVAKDYDLKLPDPGTLRTRC